MNNPGLPMLAEYPKAAELVDAVLNVWPEHDNYLARSFGARNASQLATTEKVAAATAQLIRGRESQFAEDYRWTCDKLREEELYFHREGRYRYSSFAAVEKEVYSSPEYMSRYVNGLLLTQALWFNHAATFDMYLEQVLNCLDRPLDYLEVGPGHGLAVYFACENRFVRSATAWDVSPTSIEATKDALLRLRVPKPVHLMEVDILAASVPPQRYDLIVISEVLEHLERPNQALRFLRSVINADGRLFVNVPLNSPSPDHIYLFSSPEEVLSVAEEAGFKVETYELFATQGRPIDKALKNRISISVGIVATPA